MAIPDVAEHILTNEALSNNEKAALWQIFHEHDAPEKLAEHLNAINAPEHLIEKLVDAKQRMHDFTSRTTEPNRAEGAIKMLKSLPSDVLETAEKHPEVLRGFTKREQ